MTFITEVVKDTTLLAHDIEITIENSVLPLKQIGHIVPEGQPGSKGVWPEYIPRTEGDSRGPCPFLNTLANHGILPHNGRNIPFPKLTQATQTSINMAETLAFIIPNMASELLKKDYNKDTFDLEDLALHNSLSIEHDASLTRIDTGLERDQSSPNPDLVKSVLDSATGKDKDGNAIFTIDDLAGCIGRRRAECQKTNTEYSLGQYHGFSQSSEWASLLTVFGGRVDAITALLAEERLLNGWETKITEPKGLTITEFNKTALKVNLAVAFKQAE